jgi:hypothetical protein
MTGLKRTARLLVFAAALLHALVGGWSPWLHGAPLLDRPVVHADRGGSAEPGAAAHGQDCALCHSASLLKSAAPRSRDWLAGIVQRAPQLDASAPSAVPAAPVVSGGARAPPRMV